MPTALPLIVAGVGSAYSAYETSRANRATNRRNNRAFNLGADQIQNEPGFLESILRSQFNPGQDAQLQSLRSTPGGNFIEQFLSGGGGDELIDSLRPGRTRNLREGLAEVRATSPGLGQRFGSATMRGEEDLVARHLETTGAQDAQIGFEAQGRQLAFGTSILELLAQAENNRLGRNIQASSVASGIPPNQSSQYGTIGTDIGQLMLLQQLAGNSQSGSYTPFQRAPLPTFNPTPLFG